MMILMVGRKMSYFIGSSNRSLISLAFLGHLLPTRTRFPRKNKAILFFNVRLLEQVVLKSKCASISQIVLNKLLLIQFTQFNVENNRFSVIYRGLSTIRGRGLLISSQEI